MTWEKKLAAIQVLGDTSLHMRCPGSWYVTCRGRTIQNGKRFHQISGIGRTPEEAVNDDWDQIASPGIIVAFHGRGGSRKVQWNGSTWIDVAKPEPEDKPGRITQ
jgi:hypothetical protein